MENLEEHSSSTPETPGQTNLIITEDIRSYIYETSKWTRFLSIIGFIGTGFMVLFSFSIGGLLAAAGAFLGPANPYANVSSGALTVVMLLTALLYFYPSYLLFKYSTSARKAILYEDQHNLAIAAAKMKSFFKFWGILTIIMLAFYIIIFLFMIVAGISTATMAG